MSVTLLSGAATNGVWMHTAAQTLTAGQVLNVTDESIALTANVNSNNTSATQDYTDSTLLLNATDTLLRYGAESDTASGAITLTRCQVKWTLGNARSNLYVTKLIGTTIRMTKTGTSGLGFVYTQGGGKATIDSSDGRPTVFDGIYVHQIVSQPAVYRNAIYKNCGINILNWSAGVISIRGIVFNPGTTAGTNSETWDAWVGSGATTNKLLFYSCTIRPAQIAINRACVAGDRVFYIFWARADKYVDVAGALVGGTVVYTPSTSDATYGAIKICGISANGYLTVSSVETKLIDLMTKFNVAAGTTRSTGLSDPTTIQNYSVTDVTWSRVVRRADVIPLEDSMLLTGDVGAVGGAIQGGGNTVLLADDTSFTGTYSAAASITGVAFSYSSGTGKVTATITAARTVQEIYNYWKHWISQSAQITPTLVPYAKITLIGGALNVVGTISTSGAGAITGSYSDDSGARATVTFTNLPTGTDVVILTEGTTTVLNQVDQNAGTTYSWRYIGAQSVDVGFIKPGYKVLYLRGVSLGTTDQSIQVQMQSDLTYQ